MNVYVWVMSKNLINLFQVSCLRKKLLSVYVIKVPEDFTNASLVTVSDMWMNVQKLNELLNDILRQNVIRILFVVDFFFF